MRLYCGKLLDDQPLAPPRIPLEMRPEPVHQPEETQRWTKAQDGAALAVIVIVGLYVVVALGTLLFGSN